MASVKKSIRIDEQLAERVSAARADGESETATYCRLIAAGLDFLEHGSDTKEEVAPNNEASTSYLLDTIELLKGQLEEKDKQLAHAQTIADQAQRLQARAEEKALAIPEQQRKSLPQRIKAFFIGDITNDSK